MSIRAIVVDDEPLAREGVLLRLRDEADVEVVAECENGSQAVEAIRRLSPDLIFLDIKMPRHSGFDVIRKVGLRDMPLVIFLTAYDEHAIEAFQHNALDYLLKPIEKDRFRACLVKARQRIAKDRLAEQGARLQELLKDIDEGGGWRERRDEPGRITVKSLGHMYFLRPADIDWVESEGDYVNVHTHERKHLIRETMRAMEQRLAPYGFLRIHRCAIVNL